MRLFMLLVLSVGFAGRVGAGPLELRVGHNAGTDHPYQRGFEKFKQVVESESGGRLWVHIYPEGQLGAEDKVNLMVRRGLIAAQATSAAAGLAPLVPDVEVLNQPLLIRDIDHYYRVVDGPVGQRLAGEVETRLDVVFLGWGFSGVRNVWNRKHQILRPNDTGDLKLRVINSRAVLRAFGCFGAQVTPMDFGEIYNGLQQGVIDGAETDDTDLMVEHFYEVTHYVALTEHLFLGAAYIFSRRIYDTLPPDLQRVVVRAGAAAVVEERRAIAIKSEEARAFLIQHGLVFNSVDRSAFAARLAACAPAQQGSTELIAQIRAQ